MELVRHFAVSIPILGVCLGHQAIGVAFGATVSPADHIMHGKISEIIHDFYGVYKNEESPTKSVARYHFLIIEEGSVPTELEVTSRSIEDNYILGVRHKQYSIEWVQFHPESIGTEKGMNLFVSFYETYVRWVYLVAKLTTTFFKFSRSLESSCCSV